MVFQADHTFVVLAYKESPHLEECLRSLRSQSKPSNILIATSTPSPFLEATAERFEVALRVNPTRSGIAADWNFALDQADTDFITLAHQDDIYLPEYTTRFMHAAGQTPELLIAFSDYAELKGARVHRHNLNLAVKRVLLMPFLFASALRGTFAKRALISFGSPIACPSVMYNRRRLPRFRFSDEFRVNMDWQAWIQLAQESGAFVYVPRILLHHRIHEESETSAGIRGNVRQAEDLKLFSDLWPRPIAKLFSIIYAASYGGNRTA